MLEKGPEGGLLYENGRSTHHTFEGALAVPFMELRQKTMTGDYVLCMITSKQGWMVQPVESPM